MITVEKIKKFIEKCMDNAERKQYEFGEGYTQEVRLTQLRDIKSFIDSQEEIKNE